MPPAKKTSAKKAVARRAGGSVKKASSAAGSPAPSVPPKGSKVEWKWGASKAVGKVLQVFRRKVTKTLKGAEITRNATPEKPAVLVHSENGGDALKSSSELKRVRPSGKKPRA